MIKRILGEDNGLMLEIRQTPVYLCPSRKNKITIFAANSTEYDMHLYLSFKLPMCIGTEKKETDFFVPAEGNSSLELTLTVSGDEKMYIGQSYLELAVKDRTLEWVQLYELELYIENVFKCASGKDFMPCTDMLFSRSGIIYLDKNECAMLEIASENDLDLSISALEGTAPRIFTDTEECVDGRLVLKKGLTRLCIQSNDTSSIVIKDQASEKVLCLNTINPKYFL